MSRSAVPTPTTSTFTMTTNDNNLAKDLSISPALLGSTGGLADPLGRSLSRPRQDDPGWS